MAVIHTKTLNIAYEVAGEGEPVFLLHGWPDSPLSWHGVAPLLHQSGYKTITPYLRGCFPTEFLSSEAPRFAGATAMAQDLIDLADALGITRFHVVGHDWGARIAYTVAALFPERVHAIAALALAYQPQGKFPLPELNQARHFWYQFFQCTPGGAASVRKDPVAFARIQWDTWSPAGWFTDRDFQQASQHFTHPDWAEITLNAYRSRYLPGEMEDPGYEDLQSRLEHSGPVEVPTLMIQGNADTCDLPAGSEDHEKYFTRAYQRLLLERVGHFPHREAPAKVAQAVALFFRAQRNHVG